MSISTGASPVLQATTVVKEYRGDGTPVRALDGISVTVPQGAFISVMGPSGSGKSTLLHVLGALDAPTSGEISLNGKALNGLSDRELSRLRRHSVGFVFQFFSLVPVLSAAENVALPAVIDSRPKSEYVPEVERLLGLVGLSDRATSLPSQLSGGQQQRVAIARALIMSPAILLADEPTGNLDSKTGLEILSLMKNLNAERGQTIVMVTHDPRAAAFADRVLYLSDGRIAGHLDLLARGGDERASAVLNWLQTLEA